METDLVGSPPEKPIDNVLGEAVPAARKPLCTDISATSVHETPSKDSTTTVAGP